MKALVEDEKVDSEAVTLDSITQLCSRVIDQLFAGEQLEASLRSGMTEFAVSCVVPRRALPELTPGVTDICNKFQHILGTYTLSSMKALLSQ